MKTKDLELLLSSEKPVDYITLARLLRRKDINTTIQLYSHFDSELAATIYDQLLSDVLKDEDSNDKIRNLTRTKVKEMETEITKHYLDLSIGTTHFNRYLDRLVKLYEIRDCEQELLEIFSKDSIGNESEDELDDVAFETQSALNEVNTSIMTTAEELVGLYRAAMGI